MDLVLDVGVLLDVRSQNNRPLQGNCLAIFLLGSHFGKGILFGGVAISAFSWSFIDFV